jgi:uncharacterized protein DUF3455
MACLNIIAASVTLLLFVSPSPLGAQVPDVVAAPGKTQVLKVLAEGAQIYECKIDKDGKLVWHFREPIAALILEGKTIGRHFAGPTWELSDGSAVTGKVTASTAGATSRDIPWLRLEASTHRGNGQLSDITVIQRINTKGGAVKGDCTAAGILISEPYSSEYVFLK